MTIAFVQQVGGASTVAGPTTSTGAVGGTFTAGNLLVAIVNFSSSVAACTDISIPSGWTAPLAMKSNGAPNGNARAYYMANNPGGAQTWTWTLTPGAGTGQGWAFTIFEFSGAGALDLTAVSNATGAASSTSLDTLAASGTTQTGDLLIHLAAVDRSAAGTLTTDTTNSVPTTSWNVGTQFQGTNAVPNAHAGGQYQIIAGTQAAPRGVLTSSISESSESFLLTFSPATAGIASFDKPQAYALLRPTPRLSGQAYAQLAQQAFAARPRPPILVPPPVPTFALSGSMDGSSGVTATIYQPGLIVSTQSQTISALTSPYTGQNGTWTETDVSWKDLSGNGWMLGMIPNYGGALISPWYEIDSGVATITQTSLATTAPDGFIHLFANNAGVFTGTEDPAFTLTEVAPTGQAFRRYYDSGTLSPGTGPALNYRVRTCIYPGDPGHYYHRIDITNPSGSAVTLNGADGLEIAMLGGMTQASQGGSSAWIPGNGFYANVAGTETAWPGPEPTTTVADPDYVYITPTGGSGLKITAVCIRAKASNGGLSIASLTGASNAQITYLTNANRLKVKIRVDMSSFPGSTTMTVYYVESRPRNYSAGQASSIAADYLNPDASSILSVGTAASPFFSLDEGAYVVAASGNTVKLTHTFPTNVTKRWTLNYKVTNYTSALNPIVTVAGTQLDNLSALTYVDTGNQIAYVVLMPALVASGAVAPDLNNGQVVIQQPSGVLSGSITAGSSGTGLLALAEAVAGTGVATSTPTATLSIAEAVASTSAALETESATLAVQKALAAASTATSAESGTASVTEVLAGTSSGVASVTGNLASAGAIALAGSIAAASAQSGTAGIAQAITAKATGQAAIAATLQIITGNQIVGVLSALSTETAGLVLTAAVTATLIGLSRNTGTLTLPAPPNPPTLPTAPLVLWDPVLRTYYSGQSRKR